MTYRLLSFIAGVLTLACFYFTFVVSIWLGLSLTMPDAIAAEIDVVEGHRDSIWLHGDIEHGDDAKLQRVLDYRDSLGIATNYILLESVGGYVIPAGGLVDIIVARQIQTVAGNTCLSSCFMVWAAGSTRWYWTTSYIGVHSASKDVNGYLMADGDTMVATQMLVQVYTDLGVPSGIIGKMASTPHDSMAWLTWEDFDGWAYNTEEQ